MSLKIFSNENWNSITRDERYFCAVLYFQICNEPNKFVNWLHDETNLSCIMQEDLQTEWQVGLEVCFYRDFIKKFGYKGEKSLRTVNKKFGLFFSEKRTFDLCLFSDRKIIIIEAKAQQPFDAEQVMVFKKDKERIQLLLGADIQVEFIALASQISFDNVKKYGLKLSPIMGEVFGRNELTWAKLGSPDCPFTNEAFHRAESVFKD